MSNNIKMKQPYKDDVSIGRLAKAIALVSAGGLLLGPESALATPLGPTGEIIRNGGFGTDGLPSLQYWNKTNNGTPTDSSGTNNLAGNINARPSTNVINTSTDVLNSSAGFNSAFTSAFAVLGDQIGAITSGDTPGSGFYTLTQQIDLASAYNGHLVVSYDLAFTFQSVFDGLDTSAPFDDTFTVTLLDSDSNDIFSLSRGSNGVNAVATQYTTVDLFDIDGGTGQTNFQINDMLPGTYFLQFRLDENTSASTNTAVGIDNVSMVGTMYTPEPGLLSLLGVGLGALGWSRRRST